MSRTRSGRKAQETHRKFLLSIGGFAGAFADNNFKYDRSTTRAMIILRITTAGAKEVITFSSAYNELYDWEGKRTNNAFSNISEDGLYDMLVETFSEGAGIFTAKAEYRLWNPVH